MSKWLMRIFSSLLNERGEVLAGSTLDNAQQGNQDNQGGDAGNAQGSAGGDAQGANNQGAQQTIDWDIDDNPYKKRYSDSQSQIQPLVKTLQQFAEYDHSSKTWKPKTAPAAPSSQPADFEKILEGYDPEFKKALSGFTQSQIKTAIEEYKKESSFMSEFNSTMLSNRSKAIEEFGSEFEFAKDGKMNPASPLYKLANEIIHSKYAVFNPDGAFARYNSPEAEYMATVEAYAILSKRSKQQTPADKGRLGAIQGKGSGHAAIAKNFSFDEYNKLSKEQKDAYDAAQMGGI